MTVARLYAGQDRPKTPEPFPLWNHFRGGVLLEVDPWGEVRWEHLDPYLDRINPNDTRVEWTLGNTLAILPEDLLLAGTLEALIGLNDRARHKHLLRSEPRNGC